MSLNNEQLTARVNELQDLYEQSRQEIVRRSQEHQSMHTVLEQLRAHVIDVEAKADLALRSGTRGPGGSSSINHEMGKRLDRWATGTTDRPLIHPDS